MKHYRNLHSLLLLPLLLALALPAAAQVTTGTIIGTVSDPTGATVVGATVTVTEVSKGTVVSRQSDETGSFQFPFLVPGLYKVVVEQKGFKKAEQTGISLAVDQRARVDVTLTVGNVNETVEVTATAPLVQSTSAEAGQVIEQRAVQELPLNGRNFAQLVYLAPGVTPGQAGENLSGASTFNPRAASNFNPLGMRANLNGWLIDGIDNNEYTFNTVIVQPSLESVREFKVLTGSYSAEFGRGAGVVSVSTRSGSNDWHGTGFWFHRNIELDARNVFANPKIKKPPFRRHQFGAASSGPIIRNKTFFFADYSGQREFRGTEYLNSVPTAQARLGDFSNVLDRNGKLIKVFDPFSTRKNPAFDSTKPANASNPQFLRDQYANNTMPGVQMNQVGRNIASIYPLPNIAGVGQGNFDNFFSVANTLMEDNQWTMRLDHQMSQKDSFFFRYGQQWYNRTAPQGQANCCLPTPAEAAAKSELGPYVAGVQVSKMKISGAAFNWSRVWTPALVGEFRAGYAKTDPYTVQSDFGLNSATSLGITGINVNERATGLPAINVGDYTGLSGGPGFLPARPRQINYQTDYNVYWTVGHHNLKFGYHGVRRDVSPLTNQDTRGALTIAKQLTSDPVTNTGGLGLATLLSGLLSASSRGFLIETPYLRAWENAGFLQDDWKVSRNLTLNIGMRYEVYTPEYEKYNRLSNFNRQTNMYDYPGENGLDNRLRETKYNNFAPRFGFAYDVTGNGKTVLRGGYGRSYFPEPVSASSMINQNAPNLFSQSYSINAISDNVAQYPLISQPFKPVTPLKPQTTAELNAAAPVVRGYDRNWKMQNAQSWTFNVQRQLGQAWMIEGGYAGSRGLNLLNALSLQEPVLGTGSQASRRPIQALSNVASITWYEPSNSSIYHAFLGRVQKSFSNGFQLLSNYTWGKSLDYGGSIASGGGNTGGYFTITCLRCAHGPSGYDVRHRLVTNALYDLPWGKGRPYMNSSKVLDLIVGGWQAGGIVTATTGRPFNVGLANGVNNGSPSWPLRIGSGKLDNPTPDLWFNPKDFIAPSPNTYGNAGRGILYSPGVVNVDFSMVKKFNITEKVNFQFRGEAFNLFNTPYFGFPNASIGSPTAGRITSTVGDNRSMQISGRVSF